MNLSCWTWPVEFFKSVRNLWVDLIGDMFCSSFHSTCKWLNRCICFQIKLNLPLFLYKTETFTLRYLIFNLNTGWVWRKGGGKKIILENVTCTKFICRYFIHPSITTCVGVCTLFVISRLSLNQLYLVDIFSGILCNKEQMSSHSAGVPWKLEPLSCCTQNKTN